MNNKGLEKWINKLIEEDKLWKFYKSKEFRHLKEEILREQHYECQECKKLGKITKADTVHHVQHVRKYPELALSKYYTYKGKQYKNLIAVCKSCHNKLHPEKRKDLKNRTPVGSAIDNDLYNWLKEYSKETSIPVSKLLDKAITLLKESTTK